MGRFIDDLSMRWRTGDILTKLIFVNIALFLILRIVAIVITLAGGNAEVMWLQWFELPSDLHLLLHRPWTLFTYMFAQYGVFHLLFNVLWLYWFGRFFLYGNTPKQLFALYVYGGLAGALFYIVAFSTLPYFANSHGLLIGSSASVLAIVVATAWSMPDFKVGLIFIGEVALKWIALIIVLLSLLNVAGENAGGNIAHIGGALAGLLYGYAIGNGHDITSWFNRLVDAVVTVWHHPKFSFCTKKTTPAFKQYHQHKSTTGGLTPDESESMDIILDKIKKSGYTSLTASERQRLFNASNKLK